MKLFIISDIHGSLYYLQKAMDAYQKEEADYIIILGDILYHGARNPIPINYNTIEVAALLNQYTEKIIAVRGNCDSQIDELVLDFPIEATYSVILTNYRRVFLTHGHVYNSDNLPKLSSGDILFHGHTHLPAIDKKEDIHIINPGSITSPKEDNPNSYGILEENIIEIKSLDGAVFKRLEL
jgi:putative phosphoesterase